MATKARFNLYVKAGQDGQSMGDCPFSHRAYMYCKMKLNPADLELVYVDTANKPDEFLKLNPDGKVPVMVDNNGDKIIPDSGDITKYVGEISNDSNNTQNDELLAKAISACSGVFPKFAAMMKNKDDSKNDELKDALTIELKKLNDFLQENQSCGKYLIDDTLQEIDCQILPKLRHIQIAGKRYKEYNIPTEFPALLGYMKNGHDSDIFKLTCPDDEQYIWGWGKHM